MKSFLVFALLALIVSAHNYKEEDDVIILTDDNFDEALKELGMVLVKFYAPWCGHCKRLAPEYAKAAAELKQLDPPVYLAQVDCTVEKQLATKFNIQGFPTVKFLRGDTVIDYEGGRTKEDIVKFMKKKTGPVAKLLLTAEEVTNFKKTADVTVVAAFKADSDEDKTYVSVATSFEDLSFGYVNDESAAKAAGISFPGLVIYTNYEPYTIKFEGDINNKDEVNDFILKNELPIVVDFNQDTAKKIFAPNVKLHQHMLIFTEDSKYESVKDAFTAVAKEFQGKFYFIHVPESESRLYEYFGVEKSSLPALVGVKMEGGSKKYKYEETEYTVEKMKKFVEDFIEGKLTIFLKSEPIPEKQEEPVYKIVGKTFDSIALAEGKDVLVKFYAPWCGHCKALKPIYEDLAKKLKGNDKIVIAEMDATANEVDHPQVNIRGFPTLKLFTADNKVLDFEGDRTVDAMVDFLKKNAVNSVGEEGSEGEL